MEVNRGNLPSLKVALKEAGVKPESSQEGTIFIKELILSYTINFLLLLLFKCPVKASRNRSPSSNEAPANSYPTPQSDP